MNHGSDQVEMFYLDDMEDEIIITSMKLRREKLDLNIQYFLDEADIFTTLNVRLEQGLALPSLIVTDLNMPGKGGLGVIAKLRSDDRFRDIVVGACTGSENPADETAAYGAGAEFVVIKPFGRDSIVSLCSKTGRFLLVSSEDGKEHLCAATAA